MKLIKNPNMWLGGCVVLLLLLCYESIATPLRFNQERSKREAVVKARLITIRQAEERYRERHGVYTGDFSLLVREKFLADSLRYVPFTDKQQYMMVASTVIGKTGAQIPVMECGATFGQYLQGLNEDEIARLVEQANLSGAYPGLKIGDVAEPNGNAGNWE